MNWIRKITLVLVITGSAAALQAQSGLAIRKVFDTYGISKEAVMVELSMVVLQ